MSDREYDVIVVGCRVAGASTAMLLARRGLRVLAIDRASFPSDAISTHQVQLPGGAALRRWGILEPLVSAGTPPARHVRFEGGGSVLDGHFPGHEGVDAVFSPRRTLLDAMLVDAARAGGADVREGFTVDEIVIERSGVRGIRGREGNGPAVAERARVVVGADGKHSIVAQAVGAPIEREVEPRTVAAYTYWSGLPVKGGEVYQRDRRALGLWPTNDELTLSYMAWPIEEFEMFRADIEGNLVDTMRAMGIGERLDGAERVERIRTTPDVPNVIRTPAGDGWVLVGDAGLVMDPITGQGIGHALQDAEMVADALVAGLGGTRPLKDALADYRARRDEARIPMWEFTTDVASFRPAEPEERVLFEALAGNQAETDRFFGVITGTVPVRDYLQPSNLRKIVGLRGFAKIAVAKLRVGRS
jgi:flavin-dependent dehydrogenase